jgi:hypothetical protein
MAERGDRGEGVAAVPDYWCVFWLRWQREAIAEKVSPLSLARSRYALRLKRPHREAIHDKVEHALLLQVNELQALVQDLENKEHQVSNTAHTHLSKR